MDVANDASPPPGWLDALERGEADIAAGRTVPLGPVLARMQQSIADLEASQAQQALKPAKA